jgi:stage II sporulation protein M
MVSQKLKIKFSLKEEYVKSFNYIKKSKNFIYFSISLFFLFSLIGLFVPVPEFIEEEILKIISELIQKTNGLGLGGLIGFIFTNNFQSSFFSVIFGAILGILPIFAIIFNGYLLGFVVSIVIKSGGIFSLWKILPHGIFELPAIFISFGLGIKLGSFIFYKKKLFLFKEYFWNSLRVFLFIIFPLLVIAAIIEGTLIFLN